MSEIKEGEYIRTTQGYIAKVEDIGENIIMCDSNIYGDYEIAPVLVGEEQIKLITKHSFNIIDLIEVGDIIELINGLNKSEFIKTQYSSELDIIKSHKIISILTHEQYGQNCYKVGDIE